MKRGHLLLVFLSCTIILLAGMGFVSATDCQIRPAGVCPPSWNQIGVVTTDGHFNRTGTGLEPNILCCKDVTIDTGVVSFKYSGEGHVSFKSALTTFAYDMKLGFQDTCYLTNGPCSNDNMCIFRVTNSSLITVDNSHIADCTSSELETKLCCRRTEVCNDGTDDDEDGYIDCADEDCHQSPINLVPQECAPSPYNSSTCVMLDRSTGVPIISYNSSCNSSNHTLYYCSYPLDGSVQGACCQSGEVAKYSVVLGTWECKPSEPCGLDTTVYPCGYDFDGSTTDWLTNPYTGNAKWCVSRFPPSLYNPDNPAVERSTGCCLMVKQGEVNYYTDNSNVKIFGTS